MDGDDVGCTLCGALLEDWLVKTVMEEAKEALHQDNSSGGSDNGEGDLD